MITITGRTIDVPYDERGIGVANDNNAEGR